MAESLGQRWRSGRSSGTSHTKYVRLSSRPCPRLFARVTADRHAVVVERAVVAEEPHQSVVQRSLVALHRQHVIGLCVENRLRDLGLATHRVDSHQTARDFQDFQQLGNGRDLVALRIHHHLPQGDVIGRGPGADHVNGRLAVGGVETASQGLAVDGHDLAGRDFVQCGDPTQQARLELGGLDRAENRIEAIMRGDAVAEVEKLRKPLSFLAAVLGDRDEIIGAADHCANGNSDNVNQRIDDFASSRIGQSDKMVLNTGGDFFGHGEFPRRPRSVRQQHRGRTDESHRPIHTRLPNMAQSPWLSRLLNSTSRDSW